MVVETVKNTNSQTGQLSSIAVIWTEDNTQKTYAIIKIILSVGLTIGLGIFLRKVLLEETNQQVPLYLKIQWVIFLGSCICLLLNAIGLVFKRGLKPLKFYRQLLIREDGAIYAPYGLPSREDDNPLIGNWIALLIFTLFLAPLTRAMVHAYWFDIVTIILTAVGISSVTRFHIKIFCKKDKPVIVDAHCDEIAKVEYVVYREWAGGDLGGNAVLFIKKDGESIIISHILFAKKWVIPVVTAISNAIEEMQKQIKINQKQQQSNQGVSMTVGDTTVHVNPL